jgi:methionine-rich copper-binding protein CopC
MNTKLITGLSLAVLLAFSPAIAADKADNKPAEAAATAKAPEANTTKADTKAEAPAKKAKVTKAKKAPVSNADWANLPIENKKGEQIGTVVEAVPATGKVRRLAMKL